MKANNHQIAYYDLVLDAKYGKEGTPERQKCVEKAKSFYAHQLSVKSFRRDKITHREFSKQI